MKNRILLILVLLLTALTYTQAQSIAGTWRGLLKTEALDMRVMVHLKEQDGQWSGKIDLLDQAMKGLVLMNVRLADSTLSFGFGQGKYQGRLQADERILGKFAQGDLEMPMDLERGEWQILRPQEPKGPFPYHSEEVKVPNPLAPDVTLAGTLTIPEGSGPFPAVVFISGSGPQNRDSELLMHKPFLLWADYLARHGVAVLRFDDRGVASSTGNFVTATSADFATDAEAMVDYLLSRKDLPISKVGVAGHSEGGLIAPMVAVARPAVAFAVLLAGPGIPGYELMALQTELVMRANGMDSVAAAKARNLNAELYEIIRKSKTSKSAREKMAKCLRKAAAADDTTMTDSEINAVISQANTVWFRYFIKCDPRPTLAKVKCPVLAINGARDLQVPSAINLAAIEKALRQGGNSAITIREFPGLNHLFQACTTCSVNEYGILEETISPDVLKTVGDWISKQ